MRGADRPFSASLGLAYKRGDRRRVVSRRFDSVAARGRGRGIVGRTALVDSTGQQDCWYSDRNAELTPDFLFLTGMPGDRDAFVLDASLSTQQELLAEKIRYRNRLIGVEATFIAGVPQTRRPLRAWSVAPIRASHCRVTDPQGVGGTIPLDANEATFPALDAWLDDVLHHARVSQVRRAARLSRGLRT